MKLLLPIFFWLYPGIAMVQPNDIRSKGVSLFPNKDTVVLNPAKTLFLKPEILSSGFIDIVNNGQVNASARFIRLYIGEPGKFAFPLSVYSGVSSNNFQNQQSLGGQMSNEHLVNSFINPLSGLANISMDGIYYFKTQKIKITRSGLLYHVGERILTGYKTGILSNPFTGKPINFLSSFGSAGLYFQTGAWEKNNAKNLGVFWLAGRYIFCKTSAKQIKEILPGILTNGFYHGWSVAWGVDINNLVNIKVVFYKYVKRPEIDYSLPIYQFSFNYSMR